MSTDGRLQQASRSAIRNRQAFAKKKEEEKKKKQEKGRILFLLTMHSTDIVFLKVSVQLTPASANSNHHMIAKHLQTAELHNVQHYCTDKG